eukprot:TRINITY_DN29496_c0_g5_i1.p1 TRINITY_DN29496_c0_g5~~TRINITY_DN29496_c0_g5_i1.p1  ORF type:complete len:1003 (-),score=37.55 TRINITY_DN29496_c0_g5_i1:133-3141(-)
MIMLSVTLFAAFALSDAIDSTTLHLEWTAVEYSQHLRFVSEKVETTPLHLAAISGRPDVVYKLIKQGQLVNAVDGYGKTPLTYAVQRDDNGALVAVLLDAGANLSFVDNTGSTPWSIAAAHGHVRIWERLLAHEGVGVFSKVDYLGRTPIDIAIKYGRAELVALFDRFGVDVSRDIGDLSGLLGDWTSVELKRTVASIEPLCFRWRDKKLSHEAARSVIYRNVSEKFGDHFSLYSNGVRVDAHLKDGILHWSDGKKWVRQPSLLWRMFQRFLFLNISVSISLMLLVAECTSFNVVLKARRNGMTDYHLYLWGCLYTFVNVWIIGPLLYELCASIFPISACGRRSVPWPLVYVGGLLWQGALYYVAHRLMHTKILYPIHAFHHRFGLNGYPVTATTAFAVTPFEFTFAYMMPLLSYTALFQPTNFTSFCIVCTVALATIAIHHPHLTKYELPPCFVSAYTHSVLHHSKVAQGRIYGHHAAPIFAFDIFFGSQSCTFATWERSLKSHNRWRAVFCRIACAWSLCFGFMCVGINVGTWRHEFYHGYAALEPIDDVMSGVRLGSTETHLAMIASFPLMLCWHAINLAILVRRNNIEDIAEYAAMQIPIMMSRHIPSLLTSFPNARVCRIPSRQHRSLEWIWRNLTAYGCGDMYISGHVLCVSVALCWTLRLVASSSFHDKLRRCIVIAACSLWAFVVLVVLTSGANYTSDLYVGAVMSMLLTTHSVSRRLADKLFSLQHDQVSDADKHVRALGVSSPRVASKHMFVHWLKFVKIHARLLFLLLTSWWIYCVVVNLCTVRHQSQYSGHVKHTPLVDVFEAFRCSGQVGEMISLWLSRTLFLWLFCNLAVLVRWNAWRDVAACGLMQMVALLLSKLGSLLTLFPSSRPCLLNDDMYKTFGAWIFLKLDARGCGDTVWSGEAVAFVIALRWTLRLYKARVHSTSSDAVVICFTLVSSLCFSIAAIMSGAQYTASLLTGALFAALLVTHPLCWKAANVLFPCEELAHKSD